MKIAILNSACLFCTLLCASVAFGQQSTPEPGPVPPAIPAAKSVFLSNAGSDSGLFPEPFSGDTSRAYSQFYSALKSSGTFALTSDPSQADLVLELRLIAPYGPTNANKQNGTADPGPCSG